MSLVNRLLLIVTGTCRPGVTNVDNHVRYMARTTTCSGNRSGTR